MSYVLLVLVAVALIGIVVSLSSGWRARRRAAKRRACLASEFTREFGFNPERAKPDDAKMLVAPLVAKIIGDANKVDTAAYERLCEFQRNGAESEKEPEEKLDHLADLKKAWGETSERLARLQGLASEFGFEDKPTA